MMQWRDNKPGVTSCAPLHIVQAKYLNLKVNQLSEPASSTAHRVYLNGNIDVPADRLDAVRTALPKHIALTRAETGCISFEVVESQDVAGRFMVAEVFVDQEAFDAHQSRTKASDWFVTTQGIPREYEVKVGEPT